MREMKSLALFSGLFKMFPFELNVYKHTHIFILFLKEQALGLESLASYSI